jgi:hypothetical protein
MRQFGGGGSETPLPDDNGLFRIQHNHHQHAFVNIDSCYSVGHLAISRAEAEGTLLCLECTVSCCRFPNRSCSAH